MYRTPYAALMTTPTAATVTAIVHSLGETLEVTKFSLLGRAHRERLGEAGTVISVTEKISGGTVYGLEFADGESLGFFPEEVSAVVAEGLTLEALFAAADAITLDGPAYA